MYLKLVLIKPRHIMAHGFFCYEVASYYSFKSFLGKNSFCFSLFCINIYHSFKVRYMEQFRIASVAWEIIPKMLSKIMCVYIKASGTLSAITAKKNIYRCKFSRKIKLHPMSFIKDLSFYYNSE